MSTSILRGVISKQCRFLSTINTKTQCCVPNNMNLKMQRYFSTPSPEKPAKTEDAKQGCSESTSRGLVVGIYADPDDEIDTGVLTPTGWKFNQNFTNGRLMELIKISGPVPKLGECRVFFGTEVSNPKFSAIAVCGLGRECSGYDSHEVIHEGKEAIRTAAAAGVTALQELSTTNIDVESFGHAESAAEGAAMAGWLYQELKEKKAQKMLSHIDLYSMADGSDCDVDGWRIGIVKAGAQNLTRQLQETPSNLLTPTSFAKTAVDTLCKSGVNVEVKVSGWAESQQMNSFLAVAKASCETPIFLELSYYGTSANERPIVLVGQGVTYDSGGLCLKDFDRLLYSRAEMTGAAVVVATCRAIAALRLPINIRGLVPLCENVLGCNAFKPGDCYKAMNGKNIEVQTTAQEDVLILSDALLYAQNFCPKFILDVGTCSDKTKDALDEAATVVYTNSEVLWQQIKNASIHTGCRVWRLPLWNYYTQHVCSSTNVDVQNHGSVDGEPCNAAAFLREFVPYGQWMHIDATNVMTADGLTWKYLRQGMAGRPTRTIIEFLAQTVCFNNDSKKQSPKF